MQFGLGGTKIAKFRSQIELSNFLGQAIENGCKLVDTAPLYDMGQSELQLGKCFSDFKSLKIGTKVGFVDLRSQFSQMKYVSMIKKHVNKNHESDWLTVFSPKNLSSHLEASLRRLKCDSVEYFLLHSVPGDLNLSAFAESMFRLKERGLTSKVGVSLDTPHHGDLTWCDTIEVPLRGLNWHRLKSSQEIVVNSIIKEGGLVAGNDLLNQLHDFKDLTALLGTGSLNHWKDFVKKLNGDVT
jgi:diketogulonate reductase-like aldo/keto reductase